VFLGFANLLETSTLLNRMRINPIFASKLDDFKTAQDGSQILLILPDLVRVIIGSNDNCFGTDKAAADAFGLSLKGALVAPVLKHFDVSATRDVEVVNENHRFEIVVAPPFAAKQSPATVGDAEQYNV